MMDYAEFKILEQLEVISKQTKEILGIMATLPQSVTDLTGAVTKLASDVSTGLAAITAALQAAANSTTDSTAATAIEAAVQQLDTIDGNIDAFVATLTPAPTPPAPPAGS